MDETANKRVRRSQRDYSLAFKLRVVEQVEKGELTYKQAQQLYGIQGRSTVLVWLRKYSNLDYSLPKLHQMEKDQPLSPEQQIKQLQKALKDEQDRNLIYKTMFQIIEKDYGLQVPKKLLAKQSKSSRNKNK